MGFINRFEIDKIRKQFELGIFFETGSFKGDGIDSAINAGFRKIFSTEIMNDYVVLCRNRFKNLNGVSILEGSSFDCISNIISSLDSKILFWLDAHYPGADGGLKDYNHETDESLNYPLEKEMEAICQNRNTSGDVFIIDDLRIYEKGDFKGGNLPDTIRPPKIRNIDFIYNLLQNTHDIYRLMDDQGYVVCFPKNSPPVSKYVKPNKKGIIKRLKTLISSIK